MKKYFFFGLLSIMSLLDTPIQAQITAKNAVFVELFGNGGLYSLNYDRIIFQRKTFKISTRMGVAWLPYGRNANQQEYNFLLPAEVNFLFGKQNKYFEFGLANTFGLGKMINQDNQAQLDAQLRMFSTRIGYRYQRDENGLFFRLGLTPFLIFHSQSTPSFYPSLGLSLGKSF